eukprot:366453-Chlamydomonas_euryale.AAC.8
MWVVGGQGWSRPYLQGHSYLQEHAVSRPGGFGKRIQTQHANPNRSSKLSLQTGDHLQNPNWTPVPKFKPDTSSGAEMP